MHFGSGAHGRQTKPASDSTPHAGLWAGRSSRPSSGPGAVKGLRVSIGAHDGGTAMAGFKPLAKLALVVLYCGVTGILACNKASADERVIIGRVENVLMQDVGMKLKARIDTGAGVSSITARILRVEPIEGGKGERVTFNLTNDVGETKTIRRAVVSWAEIKVKGSTERVRRPVVTMDICLGGKKLEGRFNLADRKGFLYPVLVGRNILNTGDFLIDPKRTFMEHPGC